MKNMSFENIAHATGGQLFCADEKKAMQEITGVVIDNRKVQPGNLFIPIVGQKVDGHQFIPAAFAAGAALTLSQQKIQQQDIPYILVKDTQQALKDLASFYRRQLTIPVIGIIGSVGKTSTKEMVSNVLEQKYRVLKTQGNLNNEIGMPLTLCEIREEHQVAVIEMGISDFEEMHRLGEIARPDMVIMTNIGICHLENLIDRDGVLRAKTEVLEHLAPGACVIINGDDDKLSTIQSANGAKILRYGCHGQEVAATDIQNLGLEGMSACFVTSLGKFQATIPIPGSHNVYNALAAVEAGLQLGLTLPEIARGIETAATISGRTNFIHQNDITIIDDCYNANPVSMRASLEVLGHAAGRTVAVLGDMGELGEDEEALHYQLGEAIQNNHIQVLYTAGPLARKIADYVQEHQVDCQTYTFETREAMLPELLANTKKNDTILVKASHFMEFPQIVDQLQQHHYQ